MATQHAFVEQLSELSAHKKPFVCVTIVEATGSVPNTAGGKMLVNQDGLVFGTVGGGRLENQAIETAKSFLQEVNPSSNTRLVQWNLKRDVGMTCGGSVSLYFEAYHHRVWSIVIFGAGHVANAIVNCLSQLDCEITVIDARMDWLERLPASDRLQKVQTDAPELFVDRLTAMQYVLVMTMGHRTDLPILHQIYRRGLELPYLGVIGSKAKRAALQKELEQLGISKLLSNSFRCPIGMPIGNNEPNEIAISVIAELLQVRDSISSSK